MVDLWRDVDTGHNPPEQIHVVVECLKGERNKYEYHKEVEDCVLDRVLHSNVHYPSDYGFLPQSFYDDGDPLDALVLLEDSTFPGCVVEARPIGMLKMLDDGEKDDKIIAVPEEDPRYDHVDDVSDIPGHRREEIAHFFETYKALEEGKETETLGYEDREEAMEAIEHSMELYEEEC
ncbi:inorganic diphosphatase [Halorutilales archaeon Cl-col2-1]